MIGDIVGRTADVIVIVATLILLFLGMRLSQTLIFQRRYWKEGLAREEAALALNLPPADDLPAVLVQIPAYNEGKLVERAVAAATALDWPRDRLQIQLLDDSSGPSAEFARATVLKFQQMGHDVVLMQRTDRSGFKAGALKAGLACTNQPFVAIFDADYVPQSDFLRRCMPPLLSDPGLAFVQARCDFLNAEQNRVTRAQRVILESHFAGEQPARSWSGQFLPFNGTCGIWRRAAIEDAGGWQGDTLTEDLDLSYRAQLRGWKALFLVSISVPGELPDTLSKWLTQQRRWNKGYAQSVRKLVPAIWRSGLPWRRKLSASLLLCGCVYAPLAVLATVAGILDLALGTMTYSVVIPLCLLGELQGAIGAIALARMSNRLLRLTSAEKPRKAQFGIVLYTLLMHGRVAALTARSVLEGLTGRSSTFVRTPKRAGELEGTNDVAREGTVGTRAGNPH
jgi:cellulose synthase/poly-beta-1,6-N-acetylglucosamine synthase-like glycosyltransferase